LNRLLRPPEAAKYVGGEQVLAKLKEWGWLRPLVERKRLTVYDRCDLDAAVDRLALDGWADREPA
jgi:hypothetical protein